VAENAIMLLLPVVTNCRCRRYGRVVEISYTFRMVYSYIAGVRVVVEAWRRRHQQHIYQSKYKNMATPHIYLSRIVKQPPVKVPREHFSYRPAVKPCGLDREFRSADSSDRSVSRPPPSAFGQLCPT
jgi:hypothetical protein